MQGRKEGRKEGDQHCRDLRPLAAIAALLCLAGTAPARAQAPLGSWEPGFEHIPPNDTTNHPTVTLLNDCFEPFRGPTGSTGFAEHPMPGYFAWNQGNFGQHWGFNAVHMSLIPKGPHQGKLLVWDRSPVLVRPHTGLAPNGEWWICQAWAIVDPGSGGANRTILNYLLPLHEVQIPAPTPPDDMPISDLFCSGHCWTQEGDLVVAGGGTLSWVWTNSEDWHPDARVAYAPGAPSGARWLFLFDPARASQGFAGSTHLYPGHVGSWEGGISLKVDRWYPTVTLSQPITRGIPSLGHEVVMISGGSGVIAGTTINNYETWIARGHASAPQPILEEDNDPFPHAVVLGPDDPTTPNHEEELEEYPRVHLLSTGELFKSGPTPLSGATDVDAVATGSPSTSYTRPWDFRGRSWTNQITWTPWTVERHDGAALFFATFNGLTDIVVRLGGSDGFGSPATATAEFLDATDGDEWQPLPPFSDNPPPIPGGPRAFANAVTLPDGSIVVIGGGEAPPFTDPFYTSTTAVWRLSTGWLDAQADTPTRRGYHATAALLPDGRVIVGGGETTNPPRLAGETDYDIYLPHYLQGNPPPQRPSIDQLTTAAGGSLTVHTDGTFELPRPGQFVAQCGDLIPLDSIDKLVLMAPGSITHHSDMTARYVELPSSPDPEHPGRRFFSIPDANVVPRGYYMLFALNTNDIPSVAVWVKVVN